MTYRARGTLTALFDSEPLERAADRITARTGEYLHDRARAHTPVAKPPAGVGAGTFIDERGGRRPGTARASWRIGETTVEVGGERQTIEVYSDDPVIPHLEWGTMPHRIPKTPGAVLRFRGRGGAIVFAKLVHHPGTGALRMMATALSETAVAWERIAREEIERWAREQR